MEEWYYALCRAATLISKGKSGFSDREFFQMLSLKVKPSQVPIQADWFNAILARIFYHIHNQEGFIHWLGNVIQKKFNKIKKPSFVGSITVQEVYVGPNLPVVSNIQLLSLSPTGEIKADCYVDYDVPQGGFHLKIQVMIDINLPGVNANVTLPIVLAFTARQLKGKLHVHITTPPSNKIWIGFYEPPSVELAINTEIGSKYKLSNIPKLANIIANKIKQEMIEMMVLPEMDDWPIPNVKPPPGRPKPELRKWEWLEGVEPPPKTKKEQQTSQRSDAAEGTKNASNLSSSLAVPPINVSPSSSPPKFSTQSKSVANTNVNTPTPQRLSALIETNEDTLKRLQEAVEQMSSEK